MASSISAGTTSSTALVATADTSGALQLATNNGTVAVTVDTSQNVGIGTTSPNAKLNLVAGDAASVAGQVNISGGRSLGSVFGSAGSILFTNSYWTSGYGAAGISGMDSGSSGGYLGFSTTTNGGGTTGTPTERMRIDSSGNVMVNTTSTLQNGLFNVLAKSGGTGIGVQVSTNSNYGLSFGNASGTNVGRIQIDSGSTSYVTSSDYRLKEDIAPMTGALAKVAALKPVTYKWKSDGSDAEGFIAHELAEVCPQAVSGEKDAVDADGNPHYQGIDTSFLVATLTAAIQEQQALITSLTARIAALEGTPA